MKKTYSSFLRWSLCLGVWVGISPLAQGAALLANTKSFEETLKLSISGGNSSAHAAPNKAPAHDKDEILKMRENLGKNRSNAAKAQPKKTGEAKPTNKGMGRGERIWHILTARSYIDAARAKKEGKATSEYQPFQMSDRAPRPYIPKFVNNKGMVVNAQKSELDAIIRAVDAAGNTKFQGASSALLENQKSFIESMPKIIEEAVQQGKNIWGAQYSNFLEDRLPSALAVYYILANRYQDVDTLAAFIKTVATQVNPNVNIFQNKEQIQKLVDVANKIVEHPKVRKRREDEERERAAEERKALDATKEYAPIDKGMPRAQAFERMKQTLVPLHKQQLEGIKKSDLKNSKTDKNDRTMPDSRLKTITSLEDLNSQIEGGKFKEASEEEREAIRTRWREIDNARKEQERKKAENLKKTSNGNAGGPPPPPPPPAW